MFSTSVVIPDTGYQAPLSLDQTSEPVKSLLESREVALEFKSDFFHIRPCFTHSSFGRDTTLRVLPSDFTLPKSLVGSTYLEKNYLELSTTPLTTQRCLAMSTDDVVLTYRVHARAEINWLGGVTKPAVDVGMGDLKASDMGKRLLLTTREASVHTSRTVTPFNHEGKQYEFKILTIPRFGCEEQTGLRKPENLKEAAAQANSRVLSQLVPWVFGW